MVLNSSNAAMGCLIVSGRISIIERLPERVLECGDLSPLSPLDRLGDQAEPPHSGSSQAQHVSDPDGDKSPAQSGDKSPHSKKWDAPRQQPHTTSSRPIMNMSSCSRLWQWKTYEPG